MVVCTMMDQREELISSSITSTTTTTRRRKQSASSGSQSAKSHRRASQNQTLAERCMDKAPMLSFETGTVHERLSMDLCPEEGSNDSFSITHPRMGSNTYSTEPLPPHRNAHDARESSSSSTSSASSWRRMLSTPTMKLSCLLLLLTVTTTAVSAQSVQNSSPEDDYYMPSSSSISSASAAPSWFITGLASSNRRINSTLLTYKSLTEPFQLQFRTACAFGNLITNNRFIIGINAAGNLSYSVLNRNGLKISETPVRHVVDGQWHALLFNGSRVSYVSVPDSSRGSTSSETQLGGSTSADKTNSLNNGGSADSSHSDPPPFTQSLANLISIPPRHQSLLFFDGFVGCTKLTTLSGAPILANAESTAFYNDHFDLSSSSTSNVAAYFQFETSSPYEPCSDMSMDLAQVHACHLPDSFVYCAKCQNGARCDVVDEHEHYQAEDENTTYELLDHPVNTCRCPADSLFTGKYCDERISAADTITNLTTILDNTNTDIQELLMSSNESPVQTNASTENGSASAEASISMKEEPLGVEVEHLQTADSTVRTLSPRVENLTTTGAPPAGTGVGAVTPTTTTTTTAATPGSAPASASGSSENSSSTELTFVCPCEHGGVCVRTPATDPSGGFTCSCEGTGYYGERCEIENTFCRKNPCVHGICQPKGDSYQCYCLPGFAGENCNINFDECLSSPCMNGATCWDEINKFRCQCAPGFKGARCEEEINECESHPCHNGGTCADAVANYTCECVPGFAGHSCEINIDECEPRPCLNGGVCTDLINTFSCNCTDTGFEGFFCDREIDDCLGDPCQNDGHCQDGFKSYTCQCYDGFEGADCEYDIAECTTPADPCQNEGTCLEKSIRDLYNSPPSAKLPAIFQGPFNYSNAAGYVCVCIPGYTGRNCEIDIDECASNPCGLNGKCIDGQNNFTCSCHAGYEGPLCETEINECASNPCERGTCVDKLADYSCTCPEGYGAKNCSVELIGCTNVKCFNGGTCKPSYTNGNHNFECQCQYGFAGNLCQTITTLAFDGTGYAEILTDDENFRRRYTMSFRFRTTLSEVLIAIGQGSTYFMLTLSSGKLNLQSSLLNNLNGISSGANVNNAEWHHVWIFINESHIALSVNAEQTIHPIQTEPEQPVETGFNTTVLGGATPSLSTLTNLPFFVGCIQDIKINDKKIIPGEDLDTVKINTSVVTIGCKRQEQCAPNPCMNGGSCSDLWQKYECRCPRPYLGGRCESQYIAATFGHENTNLSIAVVHIPLEIGRKFEKSFEISMFVRTREPRGTIFLLTDNRRENGLFIEAYVEEDGQLGVLAKLDEAKEETYKVGGLAINDGEPHLISFQKEKGLVKINVNGTEHFRKSLPLKPTQLFNPDIMYIGGIQPVTVTTTEDRSGASGATDTSAEASTEDSSSANDTPASPPAVTIVPAPAPAGGSGTAATGGAPTPREPSTTNIATVSSSSLPTSRTQRSVRQIGASPLNREPFKGVIQDVRVNFSEGSGHFSGSSTSSSSSAASAVNKYVVEFFPITQVNSTYLMGDSLGQVQLLGQVEKGVVSDNTCKVDPCLNGGRCVVTWNDFMCVCPPEYDGKRCGHLLPCAIVSCPTGSECHNVQQGAGFECVSEVAFDGTGAGGPSGMSHSHAHAAVSPHYRFRSVAWLDVENLTFNEIQFKFRSQRGGSILHVDDGRGERSIKIGIEQEASAIQEPPGNGASTYIAVYINGTRTVEKASKALNGSWHTVKLSLDQETNTFVLSFDGIQRPTTASRPNLEGGSSGATGPGSSGSAGASLTGLTLTGTHHQATVTLSSIVVPPDFIKSIVTAPMAQIVVGSFIGSGASNTYSIAGGGAGGMAATTESHVHTHSESFHDDFYRGCLNEIYIGPYRLPFVSPTQLLEINPENQSLVETTAPAAFYMEEHDIGGGTGPESRLHLGCILCYDVECQNGGRCADAVETYDCACETGFNGTLCEINIDECEANHCEFGSTCLDGVANYTCNCLPGYTGWLCDTEVNECDPNPCLHNGLCHDGIGSYECSCPPDYIGDNCERRKLSSCKDFPCENGASCMNTPQQPDGTFFNCICPEGYTGKSCAKMVDYCENVTCANAGTCIRKKTGVGAECICVPGWDGPRCEKDVNECLSSPCKHHGHCTDLLNRFECDCDGTGYTGPTCEEDIDECSIPNYRRPSATRCPSNATCINTPGNFTCQCHDDYCGAECNVHNPCLEFLEDVDDPICFNNGQCVCDVEDPYYRCECEPPFRGTFCNETGPGVGGPASSSVNIVYIIAPILAIILIGLIVASIMLVRVAKKKRATRGVYSPSQQEWSNPRVELDNVLKPPPEERLI